MSHDESVTIWLNRLKEGDNRAAEELWNRYFGRLVGLARRILETSPKQAADEEDVAISAFRSFCIRAEAGKFPQLEDRDNLWKLLMTITVRKALRLRKKGSADHDRNKVAFPEDLLSADEPDPEFAAMMKDELQRMLELLNDQQLRKVALLKLDGFTNKEVSIELGRHITSVERKLQRIRRLWSEEQET